MDRTLMGERGGSTVTLTEVGFWFCHTVGRWLLPVNVGNVVIAVIGFFVLACLSIGLVGLAAGLIGHSSEECQEAQETASLLPITAFTVGYSAYLATAQLTTTLDQITNRLLAPIFVPVVILIAIILERATGPVATSTRRLLLCGFVALLVIQALSMFQIVLEAGREGRGYARSSWRESNLVGEVVRLADDATICSNNPHALWAGTGRNLVWLSPTPEELADSLAAVGRADAPCIPSEGASRYLVWFNEGIAETFATPAQLAEHYSLEELVEDNDGSIYRLDVCPDGGCDENSE